MPAALPGAAVLIAPLVLAVFYLLGRFGPILLHHLTELFNIVVAFAILMLIWNARKYFDDGFLQFFGVAFFFVSIFDPLHTLCLREVNILPSLNENLAGQFWIAERYVRSASLAFAPLFVLRRPNLTFLIGGFSAVAASLIVAAFLNILPLAPPSGETSLATLILVDYVPCALFIFGLGSFFIKRRYFERNVLILLSLSFAATICAEYLIGPYGHVYSVSLFMGHYLKMASYYLIYRAIVVFGLTRPYDVLFKNLKRSEEALQSERDFISSHLSRLNKLIEVSTGMLSELTVKGLLSRAVDAARALTGAKMSIVGHGYTGDCFTVGAVSKSADMPDCPPETSCTTQRGGVHAAVLGARVSLRLGADELPAHPDWRGLPEGHPPLKGLLGVRLMGDGDRVNGAIMVSHKNEADFTAEDEALLVQLAAIVSLRLKHIEAQQTIETSYTQLQAIVTSMNDGLIIVDPKGDILSMNPTALSFHGFRSVEEARMPLKQAAELFDLLSLDGRTLAYDEWPLARALKGEALYHQELRVRRRDSGEEWIGSFSATPIVNSSGEIILAITTLQDITSQKQLEEELRRHRDHLEEMVRARTAELTAINRQLAYEIAERIKTEENLLLFRNLIDQSNDAIYVADPVSGFVLDSNAKGCSSLGYTREELLTKKVWEIRPALPGGGGWAVYTELLKGRGHIVSEGLLYRKDGTTFPVEVSAKLVRLNETDYIIAVARDITDRKRAEAERARLVAAVESAAEAIVVTDTRGLVQYVNPSFERITGFTKEEMVGGDLHVLDSGRHDEAFYRKLRETLQNDAIWSGQLINKKKDGALYHEECTIAPIKNAAGEIINYVYVRRDVTEKLRLESIAEAVNLAENMGYIFAGIRHEMGNPINSIKMALSVLKANIDTYSSNTIVGYIERSLGELARIEYLLKNLKSFNMYETPDLQSLEVRPFMDKLLALLRDDFAKKNISVSLDINPAVERCYADPRALQQVLLNIFTNAADACAVKEGATIAVRITGDSGIIHLRISDTGQGMTDEQLKDLFKPFRTSKAHGTGLGMVIAKRLLAMMGGAIAVASRRDEGTTVDISLPESMSGSRQH